MRSSVIYATLVVSALAAALVVGAACKGPDSPDTEITAFQAVASGSNTTPHKNLADTLVNASFTINGSGTSFTFTYTLNHGGAKAVVNKIAILTGAATKGTLCAAAPCPASGSVTGVTDTTLYRSMRNVGSTVRVYTDSDPTGAASGAITPASAQ